VQIENGPLLWSKKQTGKFPSDADKQKIFQEIAKLL